MALDIFNGVGKHQAGDRPKDSFGIFDIENYDTPAPDGVDIWNSVIGVNSFRGLYNDLTGKSAQSREFNQQEYLQDKMNEYNLPVNQMKRMQDAGINLNTAAAGVAQGGNESAQAPVVSSNTQGSSAALSAVGGAVGDVSAAMLNKSQRHLAESQADLFGSQANEINTLLEYKKNQYAADTAKTWIDAGMDKHMADYWSVKAAYCDVNERLDISQKAWSIAKVSKEIEKLDEDIKYRKKELDLIKHQISSAEYKAKMDEIDLYFQQERKSLYESVGVDITLPENAMLVQASEAGTLDEISAAFGKGSFMIAKGQFDADVETIEERTEKRVQQELKAKVQEMLKSKEIQEDLIMIAGSKDLGLRVADYILQKLFHTGISVSAGGIGVSQSNP